MGEEQRSSILSIRHVSKSFPGVKALDDINLDLYENEILGICGENGAGKSTLLKVFSGVYTADEGQVIFNGKERHFKSPADSIKAEMSVIHQELSYLNELSVAENIFQGRLPYRHGFVSWKLLYQQADELLQKYQIPINSRKKMRELPLAMKQLVEIVKAISIKAKIVVMDEPTSSLGLDDVKKLMEIVRQVAAEGISFIFISHRLEELFELCHRIVVIRDGKTVGEYDRKDFEQFEIVSKMVGRRVTQLYPKEEIPMGEPVLEIKNLCSDKLKDISLQVHSGEIAGLYEMAGAGQDEIMDTLFGLVKNYTGEIRLNRETLQIRNPQDAIRAGMAYVTAERKKDGLILIHSVNRNIVLASLKGIQKNGRLDYKKERTLGEQWIKALEVKTPSPDKEVGSLSGGNQQKVVLAKWLQLSPKVLLLNEPTRGVDVGAKQEIFKIVQDLCKQGMAVLMISSDMLEMMSMADHIYTVYDGRITAGFLRKEATQIKLMLAAIDKTEEGTK